MIDNLKPIQTLTEYETILARIEALMDAEPDTPEEDELNALVELVGAYEAYLEHKGSV
jgi:HTH-type transcriptional regulator/antitoxin HigA